MSDGFVPLATFLRPLPPAPRQSLEDSTFEDDIADGTQPADLGAEYGLLFAAIRRFRAGISDALDVAVQQLLEEIAENVVARELELAPTAIAAIVAKARERLSAERIIAVRVHPAQRDALTMMTVETREDDRLEPGDVVLELRSGTIDLRLRTRLAIALAACGP